MLDWFNWTNFFYLMGLVVAGGATMVGLKYKKLVDELKEVFKALQEAYEDDGSKSVLRFVSNAEYGELREYKNLHWSRASLSSG